MKQGLRLKQTEEALRLSEERLRLAMKATEAGIFDLNMATGVYYWSPEVKAIFGLSPEAKFRLDKDGVPTCIHPDDHAGAAAAAREFIDPAGPGQIHLEHRILRPDGELRWVSMLGRAYFSDEGGTKRLSRSVGTIVDITNRKVAEERLRAREELLQFLATHFPDTIFIQDRDLRYVWIKPAPPFIVEDFLGKTAFDIMPKEHAEFITNVKMRVMEEIRPVELDTQLVLKGRERIYRALYEPWRDENGSVIGVAGYVRDITEQRRVEEQMRNDHDELERRVQQRTEELALTIAALQKEITERKKAKEALKVEMQNRMQAVENLRENERLLIQQSRQAAMGEMIGNIAHQWRQPLNTLGLLIQGLALDYDLGTFSKEYLDASVDRSMQLIQHMSQTIDDFRNYFKPNKEKVSFSLAEIIRKTVSLIEASFTNHGIDIDSPIGDVDVNVTGYPNELSQVFINIMNNARDVFQERAIENPLLEIRLSAEPKKAVVTITDNAGGIPESIMEKLFDPYFTTKGPLGTGVGLFMSKVIVEKSMNGLLTVRNTASGAQFKLEFRRS